MAKTKGDSVTQRSKKKSTFVWGKKPRDTQQEERGEDGVKAEGIGDTGMDSLGASPVVRGKKGAVHEGSERFFKGGSTGPSGPGTPQGDPAKVA